MSTRELTLGEMAKALQREADRISALERHGLSLCATIGAPANQAETVSRLADVSKRDIAAIVRLAEAVSVPPEAASEGDKPEGRGRKSTHPCDKCGAMEVYVKDGYGDTTTDMRITCHNCKHSYMVDGIDA